MRGLGLCLLVIGCGADAGTPYAWVLPAGFPEPVVPEDNPLTVEKVELGRHLFYDRRLSFNETTSCGSCHEQAKAFADGRAVSEGATGDRTARNAMGLGNVAWFGTYTWANPVLETLEQQALVPSQCSGDLRSRLSLARSGGSDRPTAGSPIPRVLSRVRQWRVRQLVEGCQWPPRSA